MRSILPKTRRINHHSELSGWSASAETETISRRNCYSDVSVELRCWNRGIPNHHSELHYWPHGYGRCRLQTNTTERTRNICSRCCYPTRYHHGKNASGRATEIAGRNAPQASLARIACRFIRTNLQTQILNLKSLDFLIASVYFDAATSKRSFDKLVEARPPRVNNSEKMTNADCRKG